MRDLFKLFPVLFCQLLDFPLLLLSETRHWRCSVGKGVVRNFTKFTGKHLCQSLYFNKVAGLRPEACNFIKIETLAQVFSCEFCEISNNTFFTEHVWATASVLYRLSTLLDPDHKTATVFLIFHYSLKKLIPCRPFIPLTL